MQGHLQTVGDEDIGGHYGLLLTNEAVGGNGLKLDAYISCGSTNLSGGVMAADAIIDASGAALTEYDSGTETVLMVFQDASATTRYLVFDTDSNTVVEVKSSVS